MTRMVEAIPGMRGSMLSALVGAMFDTVSRRRRGAVAPPTNPPWIGGVMAAVLGMEIFDLVELRLCENLFRTGVASGIRRVKGFDRVYMSGI